MRQVICQPYGVDTIVDFIEVRPNVPWVALGSFSGDLDGIT